MTDRTTTTSSGEQRLPDTNMHSDRSLRDVSNTIRGLKSRYPGSNSSTQISKIIISSKDNPGNNEIYSDFVVSNISTGLQEKVQVFETFSKPVAYFFGTHPQYITVSGFLINSFTDEVWMGTKLGSDEKSSASSRLPWSARFIDDYLKRLSGTKSIERKTLVYFDFYEYVYGGRLISFQWSFDANNIEIVPFTFVMYVTSVNDAIAVDSRPDSQLGASAISQELSDRLKLIESRTRDYLRNNSTEASPSSVASIVAANNAPRAAVNRNPVAASPGANAGVTPGESSGGSPGNTNTSGNNNGVNGPIRIKDPQGDIIREVSGPGGKWAIAKFESNVGVYYKIIRPDGSFFMINEKSEFDCIKSEPYRNIFDESRYQACLNYLSATRLLARDSNSRIFHPPERTTCITLINGLPEPPESGTESNIILDAATATLRAIYVDPVVDAANNYTYIHNRFTQKPDPLIPVLYHFRRKSDLTEYYWILAYAEKNAENATYLKKYIPFTSETAMKIFLRGGEYAMLFARNYGGRVVFPVDSYKKEGERAE